MSDKWYFYIARCKDSSLYIRITSDLERRIKRHNQGQGVCWVKQLGQARLVYSEEHGSYLAARQREIQVKSWSRKKKEKLIKAIWK